MNHRFGTMAPNLLGTSALFLAEATSLPSTNDLKPALTPAICPVSVKSSSEQPKYRWQIVWRNVIVFIILHSLGLYGFYLWFFQCTWKTAIWTYFYALMAGQGITAGAHRLWAHRSYKAKLPLRIILMILQTAAFQNHLYEWVRDHRVHHKFTDTDADPHNASRGFFFSHIGWLMLKKHKDVKIKGKTVDLSDLEADPVVMFQKKYYALMMPILCFGLPALVPWYFFGESWSTSFYVSAICRYALSLNGTWLVNSAAHIWGMKPYDKNINPTENKFVAFMAFGEGWHNYHHVFPWDYKAAELGNYRLNFTTAFLDMMAKIGWAYDLKTASVDMVRKRIARTGTKKPEEEAVSKSDHHHHHLSDGNDIWGWGDKDMYEEDIRDVKIYNKID